ncbi:hypothetical protein WN944_022621 [Citrus x changshan-huyou]|uniref:Protein FAR1-RELATED SEQUENCE n=1 Tax=Citrus x changshan-huyou TaxID=2935761 RepID=A0AAP0N1T7_9ROSI
MEKQVEKMYTISKFKEFQQELTALMYCDTLDSVRSIYEISESYEQGKKKRFDVVFEETKCEVSCIYSKFQFRGILCRHALAVLIRHHVELLPEMYILSRWRKDVRRCYSKVRISYGVHNLSIQQERYDKMCTGFTEVANITADDESSYKFVLDWINKTMKDLPKQIRCASVETTAIGEALQENASTSFEMPNEISTQQSNMAMEGNTVNANLNQYESLGYSNSHYSSLLMTYKGSGSGNFQQLLHQQCNEDNNRRN